MPDRLGAKSAIGDEFGDWRQYDGVVRLVFKHGGHGRWDWDPKKGCWVARLPVSKVVNQRFQQRFGGSR